MGPRARLPVLVAAGLLASLPACSSGGKGRPQADEATQRVKASDGGTVTTPGGIALAIAPGALAADTDVRVASVALADAAGTFVGGAAFGPEGTALALPARVRIPLPAGWDGGTAPEIHRFAGARGEEAMPTGTFAALVGAPGAWAAEAEVSHFCGLVLSRNCHAGTIKAILADFERRGCSRAAVLARVNQRYPEIGLDEKKCESSTPGPVQALVDTYFEDVGGWNPGEAVAPADLARFLGYAKAGRQVVLAFKAGPWEPRGGPWDIYPPAGYAHTAVLAVDEQGAVQLRNTIKTSSPLLRQWGGGEVVVDFPAARLEEFRGLQSGVAVELAVCGRPGCLAAAAQNPFGIDAYSPLAERPVPYPSVRVYVERAGGPPHSPCAESTLSALVDVEGRLPGHAHVPLAVIGALGTAGGQGGVPTIVATTADVPLSGVDPGTQEVLSIAMSGVLPGPGTYRLGDDWTLLANPATLVFSTPAIARQDGQGPVVFVSTAGSLRLTGYGASVGSTLRGEFEANLVGQDDRPLPGGGSEPVEILGTVAGSFDVVILDVTR